MRVVLDTNVFVSRWLSAHGVPAKIYAHWEQGAHIAAAAFCFNTVMCAWFFQLRTLWPIAIAHIAIDLIVFA